MTDVDEAGSWFPVPDPSELPGDLRKLFARKTLVTGMRGFRIALAEVFA